MSSKMFGAEFKNSFKEFLLDRLFNPPSTEVNSKISNLIKKNADYLGESVKDHPMISFNGKIFSYYYELPKKSWTTKLKLVPNFQPEMLEYTELLSELYEERLRISAFLSRALNMCNTVADLYEVLPDSVHNVFPKEVSTRKTIFPSEIGKPDLRRFLEINDIHKVLIGERMIKNLLLY